MKEGLRPKRKREEEDFEMEESRLGDSLRRGEDWDSVLLVDIGTWRRSLSIARDMVKADGRDW
jgi:hypothetical protein